MAKIDKRKLPEIHIDIGSHNENPEGERVIVKSEGKFGLALFFPDSPANPGMIEVWSPRDGHAEASLAYYRGLKNPPVSMNAEIDNLIASYERSYRTSLKRVTRATRAKNPAPRIGTARPRRASQITKKAPSKRLVARRAANTRKGYFPNPVNDPAKGALELAIVSAIKSAKTPAKLSNKTDNMLTMQARLSYAQGLIQAAEILGVFTRAETKFMLAQLKPEGVIGR